MRKMLIFGLFSRQYSPLLTVLFITNITMPSFVSDSGWPTKSIVGTYMGEITFWDQKCALDKMELSWNKFLFGSLIFGISSKFRISIDLEREQQHSQWGLSRKCVKTWQISHFKVVIWSKRPSWPICQPLVTKLHLISRVFFTMIDFANC